MSNGFRSMVWYSSFDVVHIGFMREYAGFVSLGIRDTCKYA